MQDPIRQLAGWNHHHRPPTIPFHRVYLFPFTSCFWILRIDFYMYMCALGMGLMVVVAEGGGRRGGDTADGWMAGLEMTSGLTECLSITSHSLGYRWSLIFPTGAYLPAFIWQPGLANLHVRQTTNGPVHVKIGGGAWQFLHNAVSFWLDPRPRAMSPFIIRERGRWGEEIIQPSFLSPSAAASLE